MRDSNPSDPLATRRIDDVEALKAMAQPIRQRLYRFLVQLGPQTGGMLAQRLNNADPGQISYHLRELAKRGFVEDAPELATDRRQRWWRAVEGTVTWSTLDFATPEGQAVARTLKGQMVIDEFERLRHFEQTRSTWSPDWQEQAYSSDSFLQLTPTELGTLTAELHEVLKRYSSATLSARKAADPDGDRRPVLLFLHAFPERP